MAMLALVGLAAVSLGDAGASSRRTARVDLAAVEKALVPFPRWK